MTSQLITPLQAKQRIDFIDILRGFALFGVLVINIYTFSQPPSGHIGSSYNDLHGFQEIFAWFINIFITGKFYTIFSFLFGLGFAIQIERLRSKTDKYISIYVRRLFILIAIGFIHAIFLYTGDILKLYALNGFLLLLFRNSSPKKIFIWAASLSFVMILIFSAATISDMNQSAESDSTEIETKSDDRLTHKEKEVIWSKTYESGSFYEITKTRIEILYDVEMISFYIISPFVILPLFLMGAYFGKKKIFQNLKANKKLFRKMQLWGLLFGILLSAALVAESILYDNESGTLKSFISQLNNIAMASFLVGSAVLLFLNNKLSALYKPLKCLGQSALSNYLLQSLVFGMLMFNYGFGFAGKFNVSEIFCIAVALFILQAYLSVLWMNKFRFGPAEWLWRSLTYRKFQSMKKNKS